MRLNGDRGIDSSTRKPLKLSIKQMASMSRLLDEALDLDETGRRRWLAALPREHRELAPMLREALLSAEAHAVGVALATLPKFVLTGEPGGLPVLSPLQPGTRVGPYELIRALGAGGMAQVWLARRADGAFKREVALKLPMLNSHRGDLAERFVRERDILAALEHPHIARLYDAGIDAGGLPYLSMEYVQGEALTEWCDVRQLGISARLEVFMQVLEAVQYAHEKQVIHRDLKPSNILVTQSGQVRLLDFGVAKLLEAGAEDQKQLTEVHGRALTPDYASPELLHGDSVDDRSDVYSLGVLLYELMTGTRPYQLGRAASLGLLDQAIATVDPKKPSQQLTQPAAVARATTPDQLNRRLRGDLDAIVLKALAKEPAQRYSTVQALGQDLRRYLDGKPVQALPARFTYRVGKFVRRHKTAVAALATAAAVILIAVGYTVHREGLRLGAPPGHSVAVLPFVDLSEHHDQEYFSDGLTEEVLDLLAKIPGLQVIARTSSFSFKGKSEDIQTIARQLNVATILQGSVRKSGRRLRVTTHLVRAATGEELWSATYDRELKDVFQVQDQIAGAVTRALKLELAAGPAAINTHHTANTEAYNQYLLGLQFFQRDTRENEELSVNAFRKAVELDPGYAAAYAGLAISEIWLAEFIGGDNASLRQQAMAAADEAIALAPDEAGGYVARGQLRLQALWDWAGAESDLEKALANEPADTAALLQYGAVLQAVGRLPDAIAVLRQAVELDPLAIHAWNNLGVALTLHGQFAAAHDALRRALEIQPKSIYVPWALGNLELLEGHASEALATFRPMEDTSYRLAGTALAEQTLGHVKESQQALDELIVREAQEAAYQIAEIYALRGDRTQAFGWLERSFRQRDPGLTALEIDPLLAPLHADARFGALLARIHRP